MTDHVRPAAGPVARRAVLPTGRATRRHAGRLPGRRPGGRDQGLGPAGPRPSSSRRTGPAAAAAVFTPNAFAAAPVRLSTRAPFAASGRPAGRVRLGRGDHLDQRLRERRDRRGRRRGPGARSRRLVADRGRRPRGPDAPPLDRDHRDAAAARQGRGRDRVGRADARAERRRPRGRRPRRCARPIRSTKVATTTVELPDADGRPVTVTVSGIAKGVGMIHPRMATMLVGRADRRGRRRPRRCAACCGRRRPGRGTSCRVDGDTSTNDTVFLLASGARGPRRSATAAPRRPCSAPRSRPSPATSPASRPPTARAPRR